MSPATMTAEPTTLPSDAPPAWLRGRRVALREFCARDLGALMRMHGDNRLRANLLDDQPLDKTVAAVQFLVNMSRFYRAHEGLGIWHASTGTAGFIGWFNLMPLASRGDSAVELGSRLLPDAWGGALALEGGELLLAHAFERLALPRVWATCAPANRSARSCLAALGFTEEGLDDYEGRLGVYAFIDRAHWQAWQQLPRRERRRSARGVFA